jgi:hypothetical protein
MTKADEYHPTHACTEPKKNIHERPLLQEINKDGLGAQRATGLEARQQENTSPARRKSSITE